MNISKKEYHTIKNPVFEAESDNFFRNFNTEFYSISFDEYDQLNFLYYFPAKIFFLLKTQTNKAYSYHI